ncbi:hypothetical protein C8J57DRAFT_1522687 [Mycena rebaudengoi]|nr:hypothetical protein C8J57DRAFT_1522687 [Mycena rebaudengoi]
MLNTDEFGITLEEEDSADDTSEHESSSSDDESDYEEFRRRRKQREKKKKQDKKRRLAINTEEGTKEKQKFGGTEEEVASMIRKLNTMKLDDPDYAPVFYKVMVMDQTENRQARIEEVYTESEPESLEEEIIIDEDSDTDGDTFYIEAMEQQAGGPMLHKIYLTVPNNIEEISSPMVQAAERAPKETRTARKEVFDGVHVTARDKSKTQALKNAVKDLSQDNDKPGNNTRPPQSASKRATIQEFAPTETPADVRKTRFDPVSQDIQMKDASPSGNSRKTESQKENEHSESANRVIEATGKPGNRQTGLTSSVNKSDILNRILDTSVTMSVREVMETAKEIRTEFQELIKVRNIRQQYLVCEYKREDEEPTVLTQPTTPDMTDTNHNSVPPPDSSPVLTLPNPQIYEPILFLDRTATARPRCYDFDIGNCTPVEVIDTMVRREWRNYLWQQPIHLRPGFSAMAQLSYHGVATDECGQRIHLLSSLNSIQIITEPENGRSSTLLSHAFTYFLECPEAGQEWRGREAPYPTSERINNATASLTHSDEPALSFPYRGTASPPLLPREVRELPEEVTGIRPTRFPEPERGVHPPNDSRWSEPAPPYEPDVSVFVVHESDDSPKASVIKTSTEATSPPSSDTVETSPTTSSDDDLGSSAGLAELDARSDMEEEELRRLDERISEIRKEMEAEEDEEEAEAHANTELTEEEEKFFKWLDAQRSGGYLSDHSLPPHAGFGEDDLSDSNGSMPSLVTMDSKKDESAGVSGDNFACPMCLNLPHQVSYRECSAWRAPSLTPTHLDSKYKTPPIRLVADRTCVRPDTPIPPRVLLDSGMEITMVEFRALNASTHHTVPAVPQSHWTRAGLQKWVDSTKRALLVDDTGTWENLDAEVHEKLVLTPAEELETMDKIPVHRYARRHSFDLKLTQHWARHTQETPGQADDNNKAAMDLTDGDEDTDELVDELMMYAEEFLGGQEEGEGTTDPEEEAENTHALKAEKSRGRLICRAFSSSDTDDQVTTDSYDDIDPYQHQVFHDVELLPFSQNCSKDAGDLATGKEPLFLPDNDSESGYLPSHEFLETCQGATGHTACPQSPDPDDIYKSTHWRRNCTKDQQVNKEWEMGWAAEPFEDARDTAYGELRFYLDPVAMAARDIATFPDPAVSTSLPFVLPIDDASFQSDHTPSTTEPQVTSPKPGTTDHVNAPSHAGDHGGCTVMARNSKRKANDRDSPLSPSPRYAKKFRKYDSLRRLVLRSETTKAAYLENAHIIALYSRVRQDILEGISRAEDIVTRHDNIDLESVWVSYRHR